MLTGLFFGNLLPINGKGTGPGGIDLQTFISCNRTSIGKARRPAHVYHERNMDEKDMVIGLQKLSERQSMRKRRASEYFKMFYNC
jgi:hypothetical protein